MIVTAGAQQGFDLVGRLLLDPGDPVCIEDPGYPGAAFAFKAAGARIVPVPTDSEGIQVDWAARQPQAPKIIYTTPTSQFPMGTTMSLPRRLQLLNWAIKEGAWIIEDEYDAEYRYIGRPVPAFQSLDDS